MDDSHINAIFSCVNNSRLLKGITKSLNGSDTVSYKLSTGGELQFNTNKSFVYVSRNDPNRKIKGTWECNGSNEFIVNAENGARLDSKVGEWKYDVQQQSSLNEKEDTSHLIKKGDNGDHVKEVQELLKNNGYTNISTDGEVDGIFGDRTFNAVKDFQSSNKDNQGQKLKVTGHVDKPTMDALKRKNLQENIIKKVLERNLEMKNK